MKAAARLGRRRFLRMEAKPDIVVLTYFINDAEPIPTYPKESWLDLHSAAWIVLNYRLDSLIPNAFVSWALLGLFLG